MNTRTRRQQRGFTLAEAVVAFGVTATGLLAVASFQGGLIGDSAYSKARTEALSLAQQKIEEFKQYTLADKDSYIDNNNDGVMDPDGTYADPDITGQNAIFMRSWDLTTGEQGKVVDVTVSWTDSTDETQSVNLSASIPWISPRSGADQIAQRAAPLLNSPTGRAELGDGTLSDYPNLNPVPISGPGDDGLSTYQNEENLLLVDSQNRVLLTLLDVCDIETSQCTDFVKISGTVYVDWSNTHQSLQDLYVISSDAAHCQRWVESGSLSSPPQTASGDYKYFHYTCYLGGGWHGNIGLIIAPGGVQQTDKVCQGDPTSLNAWEEPVIALRRSYRGMIYRTVGAETLYESHGIKDAVSLQDHDFVLTSLPASETYGTYCEGLDAPMTRDDSSSGRLFAGMPTDFFCLNQDDNGDGYPDYLDSYDTSVYSATTVCPYDPTDPPVQAHQISGIVSIVTANTLDLSAFVIETSDGPGNCTWSTPLTATTDGYTGAYVCDVYDWGTGWTGYVRVEPNSNQLYCANDTAEFTDLSSDATQSFGCIGSNTVLIEGSIQAASGTSGVSAIALLDPIGSAGYCSLRSTAYRCLMPYSGTSIDLTLVVTSDDVVCGSVGGEFSLSAYTAADSPYRQDIAIASVLGKCP
jgi:Tfp pilus assembly protein PilV